MASADRAALLEELERVQYRREAREAGPMGQMSMADALLALAEIDNEREYQLCRLVAEHLLGKVPEPDDSDLDAGG